MNLREEVERLVMQANRPGVPDADLASATLVVALRLCWEAGGKADAVKEIVDHYWSTNDELFGKRSK